MWKCQLAWNMALASPQLKPHVNNWYKEGLKPVKEQIQNLYKYTIKIKGGKKVERIFTKKKMIPQGLGKYDLRYQSEWAS